MRDREILCWEECEIKLNIIVEKFEVNREDVNVYFDYKGKSFIFGGLMRRKLYSLGILGRNDIGEMFGK